MFSFKGKKNKIVLVAMDLDHLGTTKEKKKEQDEMVKEVSDLLGKGFTTIVYDRRHSIRIIDD